MSRTDKINLIVVAAIIWPLVYFTLNRLTDEWARQTQDLKKQHEIHR